MGDVDVASAGVTALDGTCATDLEQDVAGHLFGLDLSRHAAQSVRRSPDAGLVLAMDQDTLDVLRRLRLKGRVELLGDYAGTGEEVDDPYGGTRQEYEACARQIDRLVRAAIARLIAERHAQ